VFIDEAGMVVMRAFYTEGEQLRPLAGRFDGTAGRIVEQLSDQ
jgi:hypothetical protein